MELTILLFLFGGLFLGWSLGANDAANVFGTAVGTRMVNFRTAAIICSIFVILGAVVSGSGTTETIGKLGAINALPGAFACCVAAGFAVYLMTKIWSSCFHHTSNSRCHYRMESLYRITNRYRNSDHYSCNMDNLSNFGRCNCDRNICNGKKK